MEVNGTCIQLLNIAFLNCIAVFFAMLFHCALIFNKESTLKKKQIQKYLKPETFVLSLMHISINIESFL